MTHTDDALTEAVAKVIWDFEREDWETWEILPEEWQDGQRAQARAAIATIRQFDEQSALNCGHCTPNTDEIACACQIKERDDE